MLPSENKTISFAVPREKTTGMHFLCNLPKRGICIASVALIVDNLHHYDQWREVDKKPTKNSQVIKIDAKQKWTYLLGIVSSCLSIIHFKMLCPRLRNLKFISKYITQKILFLRGGTMVFSFYLL